MEITCPDCQFTKSIPADLVPKRTVIANCPKCGCRFRFSVQDGSVEKLPPIETFQDEQEDGANRNEVSLEKKEGAPLQDGVRNFEEAQEGTRKETGDGFTEEQGKKEQEPKDDPLPDDAIIIPSGVEGKKDERGHGADTRQESKRSNVESQPFLIAYAKESQGNPWDRAPGKIGWIASFYQTCLRILFAAPRFFSSLSTRTPFYPPLLFFLIICALEIVFNTFWAMVLRGVMSGSSDPQVIQLLDLIAPHDNFFLTLFLQMALSALKLYLFSGIFFCIFQLLAPKNASFNMIFQVVAYSVAPSLLGIVPLVGTLAGVIWGLACLATGLRTVLHITWGQTIVSFLPFVLLFFAE